MKINRAAFRTTLISTISFASLLTTANSFAQVSQSPLSLTVGVATNMLLTLDDSGSMRWAFAPDAIRNTSESRRSKSSHFNPLYYNPNATYIAPKIFNTAGTEQQLSTNFGQALDNGYSSSVGTTNLTGTNYSVSWDVPITNSPSDYSYSSSTTYAAPTGTVLRLARNPALDFSASVVRTTAGNAPTITTPGGISFTINRTNNNSSSACTATAVYPNGTTTTNVACTRDARDNYTASLVSRSVLPYYYTYDNTLANNCNRTNDACYRLNFVSANEQQNFANWYSFYRNRALATISAAALAFYDLSSAVRLSWQSLGNCTTFGSTSANNDCKINAFKEYTPTHKGQLYSWLQSIVFDQSTPLPEALKRAGEFYSTATPWQKNPNGTGNTDQNTYACRPSYHIMMTDGQWNAIAQDPANFRHDNTTFTLPDGRDYNPMRPYQDATGKTLADLAMHYWASDLRPNLDNRISPYLPFKSGNTTTDFWDPRNDPATWQHMTNFIMGLGLTESLNNTNIPWNGSTFTGGYSNIANGTTNWPAASSGSDNNVYDLWHAAINSRGEFFSVDSPEDMVQAFVDILNRIAARNSTAARPAINSGQISTDINDNGVVKTVSYQTSYSSEENWSGELKRFEKAWNSQTNTFETTLIWNASDSIPGWQSRNIKIAGDTNSGLVDFTWSNAGSSSTQDTLAYWLSRDPENANTTDTKGEQRLNYLRGNREGEGSTFRTRNSMLGDFYSSTPAVVLGPRYLVNVANNLEGNDAYTDFAEEAKARTPRAYVGSNDGMLHGFNALTGAEEFAFIPTAVFNKLNKLTGSNYSHEFYVDGSPVIADIYDGSEWRTILVGTLKAGGKSIFALDITTPGQEKLLWEFDDSALADSDVKMGYSFSQPTIARLHTGKWTVVFGNGYESAGNTNGKAALFIVDAVDGSLLKSLPVQGTDGVANGLSTPKLGDYDADGVADYAYAGDLQGNVWRFDLLRNNRSTDDPYTRSDDSESAINDFKVSYGDAPLFKATFNGTNQPITSAPSLVLHPSGTGYLVMVGTGKFFETGDKEGNKNIAQSVYGIWDKETRGETASDPRIARSSLQAQEITTTTTVSAIDGTARQGRVISNNAVDWNTQNGWYLNLIQTDGEMVVENMSQLGRTLFLQSLVPNSDPCGDGANNWTYALNPFTGGRTNRNSFDYTPTTDVGTDNISAIRQDGEGGGTISQNSDNTFQYCTGQECTNIYPDPSSLGRQSWRRVEIED